MRFWASWIGGWYLEHFLWPKLSTGMQAVMAYCVASEALTPLWHKAQAETEAEISN